MQASTPTSPREIGAGGQTHRSWWRSARESWTTGADWTFGRVALVGGAVVLLAAVALWLLRPGGPISGPEPLEAGLAYSSVEDGYFVYRLLEPRSGPRRLVATLQSIYDAHKAAVGDAPMSVIVLRRTADATPFITGTAAFPSQEVLAMATTGAEGREAAVRPEEGAPMQTIQLSW